MSFLDPIWLVGLAAVAVPVLVHLLGRTRLRERAFAPIGLVRPAVHEKAPRARVRDWLLMLARAAAVAAIALVLARPVLRVPSALPVAAGVQSVAIVIDDSFSMRYRARGAALIESARDRALEVVSALGPAAEIALVRAAEGAPAPVGELTRDHARVRRAIGETEAGWGAGDLAAAIARAREILRGASTAHRMVLVVTDGTRAAFGGRTPPAAGEGEDVALRFLDVAEGIALENRAVTAVTAEPAESLGPRTLSVAARVARWGGRDPEQVDVELEIGGRPVARGRVALPPEGEARHVFSVGLSAGGAVSGAVRIAEDALPGDDVRDFRAEVARRVRALVIDGDPRAVAREDEVYFLRTALAAEDGGGLQARVVPAESFDAHLSEADVALLCNVAKLDGRQAQAIARFVRDGGGLLLAPGDHLDADAINQALGDLLPQPIAGAWHAGGSRAAPTDPVAMAGARRIAGIDDTHPVIAPFAETGGEGLTSARFWGTLLLRPTPGDGRRTLLRFDDGAPALIETRAGLGRVLLFASTVDRDWNDLPIRPGYLPLVQQAVRYLGGASLRPPPPPVPLLSPQPIRTDPSWKLVRVARPDGRTQDFEVGGGSEDDRARPLVYRDTGVPGRYRVLARGSGPLLDSDESFAVVLDPRESDITPAPAGWLADRGGVELSGTPLRQLPAWPSVAASLVALLLCEALLARRRA